MNTNLILAGLLGAIALAAVVFFVLSPAPAPVQTAVQTIEAMAPPSEPSGDLAGGYTFGSGSVADGGPPISVVPTTEQEEKEQVEFEEIREKMQDAMVTYSVEGIPVIEPFLSHPNPEIREEALDAMIQLSVTNAGPVLRKAAQRAKTPQEKVKLLEAADFVELPDVGSLKTRASGGER